MHGQDWIEKIRRSILPTFHALLSKFGLYAASQTNKKRYSCTVHETEEQLEKKLCAVGFLRNPLAALKYRMLAGNRDISEGSWLYFTMEDPISIGPFKLPRYQYHLTLYESGTGGYRCYVHKELWWGTSPIGHYNGRIVTAAPDWLLIKFDEVGIKYTIGDNG